MSDFLNIMLAPFVACFVLVGIHAYLGTHVLIRGIIFVDLALAQFAALGATLAILWDADAGSGLGYSLALGFTLVGALVFSYTRNQSHKIPQEAFIGVAWAVASSAGILAVSSAPHGADHIESMLVGSILWVTWPEVVKAGAIYVAVGIFHWLFRRQFLLISRAPKEARAQGLHVRWFDFLFYASFGFVVTSSVKMAGVLLVFSFLIVPSMVGALFAHSIRGRLTAAWAFGWLVSMLGCGISYGLDLPTGATIVCVFGSCLLLVLMLRKLQTRP